MTASTGKNEALVCVYSIQNHPAKKEEHLASNLLYMIKFNAMRILPFRMYQIFYTGIQIAYEIKTRVLRIGTEMGNDYQHGCNYYFRELSALK